VVVEVQAGDSVVRPRYGGLLLDGDGSTGGIELHHAVALWVTHVVAENRGARGTLGRRLKRLGQAMTKKNVVAENERHRVRSHEVAADDERVRQTLGSLLHRVLDREPELAAVPEQLLEVGAGTRRRDQQDVA